MYLLHVYMHRITRPVDGVIYLTDIIGVNVHVEQLRIIIRSNHRFLSEPDIMVNLV